MAVLGKDGEGLPLEFNRENVRSENRKGTDRNHQNLGHMEISPRKNENSNQSSQFASWPQFPPAPVLLGVQISRHFRCFGAHFDLHVQGQTLLRCSKKTWRKKRYCHLVGGSTPPKTNGQLGWLFPVYGKIKNVPNHQPVVIYCACLWERNIHVSTSFLFSIG